MNRTELLAKFVELGIPHDPKKLSLSQEEINVFERVLSRGNAVSPILLKRLQDIHDSGNLEKQEGTKAELGTIIAQLRG